MTGPQPRDDGIWMTTEPVRPGRRRRLPRPPAEGFPAGPGGFARFCRYLFTALSVMLVIGAAGQLAGIWIAGWAPDRWETTSAFGFAILWALRNIADLSAMNRKADAAEREATVIDRIGRGIVDYLDREDRL